MFSKALSRIVDGARTPEGKVIAILLAICLSLMTWNVAAISYAVNSDANTQGKAAEMQPAGGAAAGADAGAAAGAADTAGSAADAGAAAGAGDQQAQPAAEPAAGDAAGAGAEGAEVAAGAGAGAGAAAGAEGAAAGSQGAENPDASQAAADKDKDDTPRPAQSFVGGANGVTVNVEAPEGAFPEGTDMRVAPVSKAAVFAAVDAAVDGEVTDVVAIDVSFWKNGAEVEPAVPVRVSMKSAAIAKAESDDEKEAVVVHIDDRANAEVVEQAAVTTASDEVAFATNEFSVYVIATTEGEIVTPQITYLFQDENGNPYYFRNADGQMVDTQVIKNGESLQGVDTPPIAEGQVFNGWFVYDNGSWGTQVRFNTPISVTKTSEVVVRPNYEQVAYVMFYEDSAGTNVLNRVQVTRGSDYVISQTVAAPKANLAFAGWSTQPGQDDDDRAVITDNVVTVNEDISYYPVFKSAHWLTFVTAPAGSGATYFAPASVLAGATATNAKPSVDPEWKGHAFQGWSTTEDPDPEKPNQFRAYDFNQVVTADTTLYAQWTAGEGTYTVVYWKQNVSDSKNLADADKTYAFASQETRTATVGSTVKAGSIASADEGFQFNQAKSDSQITVDADGSSVLNVYYDRKLITMKFYKSGSSTSAPGYSNSQYNTSTSSGNVTVFSGLYGQSLAQNGYTWPSGRYSYYYNSKSSMGMSYLGQFILPDELFGQTEMRLYYSGTSVATIEFYLQNADGSYPSSANDTGASGGGNFNLSEKYDGYTVTQYRRYTGDHNWVDSDWVTAASGTQVTMSKSSSGWGWGGSTTYYNLAVRYQLKTYKLKYLDSVDGTELAGISTANVKFSQPLASFAPKASYTPSSQTLGKVWNGKWYKDQACSEEFDWSKTMPNSDMNVYAGWEDVWYWVKIDPNGGELTSGESTWFWETYGKTVEQYGDVTRNYDADPDGNYYYHYDNFNNANPEGAQPTSRTAYYTEDAAAATSATRYSPEKNAYALVGWYDITNGSPKAYNFGSGITGNLILQAKWRKVGEYHVSYQLQAVNERGQAINGLQVTNVPTDGNSYADKSETAMLKTPTIPVDYTFLGWYYDGDVYNPGDVFAVDSAAADENKTVYVYPVLVQTKDLPIQTAQITYNGNGGLSGSNETITYSNIQNNANFKVTDQGFVRQGYTLAGWSSSPNAVTADFKLGSTIGVDTTDPESNVLYAVWNINKYDITVTKQVEGVPEGETPTFAFSYTLDGEAQANFLLAGEETTVQTEGGTVNVASSKVIEDVPYGTVVSISEECQGYATTVNGQAYQGSYTFTVGLEDTTVAFVNTRVVNDVTLTKTFAGQGLTPDQVAALDNFVIANDYQPAKLFKLSNAQAAEDGLTFSWTLQDVPYGTTVSFTEGGYDAIDGYFWAGSNDTATATVMGQDVQVSLQNDYRQKAQLNIVGASATVDYTGSDVRVDGFQKVTCDGIDFAAGEDGALQFTYQGETYRVYGVSASATGKDAGTYDGTVTGTPMVVNASGADVTDHFTVSVQPGSLQVAPIPVTVTVTGKNATATYDAAAHQAVGYDVQISNPLYTEDDFTFNGSAEASRTEEGTTQMGLVADQFVNGNANFGPVTFDVTDGYMTIVPVDEVVVTITGHTNTTVYDGQEHAVEGYDVQVSNPLYTEDDFTFTGEAQAARIDAGTTQMGLAASQFSNKSANFAKVTFVVEDGYQTITPVENEVVVVVTGRNVTADYDGNAHAASGYGVRISNPLYTEADFTFSGAAEVTRTDAGTTQMGLAADQFKNTNGNFANVTFQVTDGFATVTMDIPLYTQADFTFSGTDAVARTDAGTTQMGLAASQFVNQNANFSNVTFLVTDGYQTVNPVSANVTITGHNATATYDGAEHAVSGYDVQVEGSLYTADDFTFNGSASAARTNAGTAYMGLAAEQFQNTNPNFKSVSFVVTDGYQAVLPASATVTITGHAAAVDYDGAEHGVAGYDVSSSNPLYKESDFTFTGEAQAARTDAGTTQMGLAADQFTNTNPNFVDVTFNVTDGYQTVNPLDVTVTIVGSNDTAVYDGAQHSASGYEATFSTSLYTADDFAFNGTAEVTRTTQGTSPMGLTADQFSNKNSNFATVTFNVTDGYVTITPVDEVVVDITGHVATADYDGREHTVEGYDVRISNSLYAEDDFVFSGTATATRTDAGTAQMGLAASQFSNQNENFAKVTFNVTDGYQQVDPIDVTVYITGANNTADYDGTAHKVQGYGVSFGNPLYTEADFTFSGTDEVSRTDAGTTNMNLCASQFANVSPNFRSVTFDVVDGYQTVTPIDANVRVVGANSTVSYDGNAHTVEGYTATAGNLLYNPARDLAFNGTATASRTDAGTTQMGLDAGQFTNTNPNFATVTVEVADGFQQVDRIGATVTITGHTGTAAYDGAVHTTSGYDVSSSTPLYTEADFTFSGASSAARTDAGTTQMGLAADQFSNANENFTGVTFIVTDGYQQVTPINTVVRVKGHTDAFAYDGQEHTVEGYDATPESGLYKQESITFSGTASVSRTDAGTSPMGLAADMFGNADPNFATVAFQVEDGSITIVPADEVVVRVTGHSTSVTYDGQQHGVEGYDVEISSDLYTADDFAFTGLAAATRTDAGTTYMGLAAEQFHNNSANFAKVTFSVTDGYVEVLPLEGVQVQIAGHTAAADYDGRAHTVEGYDFSSNNALFGPDALSFNGQASATRSNVVEGEDNGGRTYMGLTADMFASTSANFKNVAVIVTDGYQQIDPITATVNIAGHHDAVTYDGVEHGVTGYDFAASTPLYKQESVEFTGTAAASRTDEGTTYMGLLPGQFSNTDANFSTVTFLVEDGYMAIAPVDSVVVRVIGHSSTVDYDGAEHSVSGYDVQISNPLYTANDFTFSGTAAAARTDQGTTQMGLDAALFSNVNSNFAKVTFDVTDGYQTVLPIAATVHVTGHTGTVEYDGQAHIVSGYDVQASNSLYRTAYIAFSGNAQATRTDAGTQPMGLSAAQFTNASANFSSVQFVVEDGYSTVTPTSAVVNVRGHAVTETYDGQAHGVSGYDVQIENPLYTQDDFTFGGIASASRTAQGTTYMGLAPEQFANANPNFRSVTFNVTDGYVAVVPLDAVVVTITGHSSTDVYDGQEHAVEGYDVQVSNDLYTQADFTFSGTAQAARTDAGITYMGLAPEQFSNGNENFSNVVFTVTDGYQQITPLEGVEVTITGHSNAADYDGAAHSVAGFDFSASNPLYAREFVSFNGSAAATRTNVVEGADASGTTHMGLTTAQFGNANPNFADVVFNVTDGYQQINSVSTSVTIVGNHAVATYDGQEHHVNGYQAHAESALYDVTRDFAFTGSAQTTRTDEGTSQMGLEAGQFQNNNANFSSVTFNVTDGFLTIAPVDSVVVTIAGHKAQATYDGEEHAVSGYDVAISNPLYTASDFTFSGTAQAARTNVVQGDDASGRTYMGLAADQFSNTNNNFAGVVFNVTDGYQDILPADASVRVTGHNATDTYDGEEHAVSGYDVTTSTQLYTASDVSFSGTAEAVRTNEGTTYMGLLPGQFGNANPNFRTVEFTVTDGYQTITPVDQVVVRVTGHNATVTYDGEEHAISGYDMQASTPLYTADDFTFNGTATTQRTDAGTAYMGLNADQFSNKSENFANVTFVVVDGYQTVEPANASVTITGNADWAEYDGREHAVSGYDVKTSTPLYTADDFTFSGTASAARTEAGTTYMELAAGQFANKNPNFAKVTFNVTDGSMQVLPVADEVVVSVTGNTVTATYDGEEHAASGYEYQVSNPLYTGEDFSFGGTASAARTGAGTTQMGLAAEQFSNISNNFANVRFAVEDGYAKVNPATAIVTITGHNATADYNGAQQGVTGYDFQTSNPLYTQDDFSFNGTAAASRADVGTTYMGLKAAQFANTSSNFTDVEFVVEDGYQTVQPIGATVTITGKHVIAVYDGEEHAASGYDVLIDEPLYTADNFTFSGTAEAARTNEGTTQMGLEASQFENTNGNFTGVRFVVEDGYATVTPVDEVVVRVTGHTTTEDYNGNVHVANGYDVEYSTDLYTEADFTFNGTAEVSLTDAGHKPMGLAADQFVNTNGNFAHVTFDVVDGYVQVDPIDAEVTITGHEGRADYDGNEHAVAGYDVSTNTPLYTAADFAFSGTAQAARTDAGSANMGLDASHFANQNPNFRSVTFNVADGVMTVDPIDATVEIVGATGTNVYNGAAHVTQGYKASASTSLYDPARDLSFSGTASAARTDVGTTPMGLATTQFANTNPNFRTVDVTVTDGWQMISPLQGVVVEVTGRFDSTPYDAHEHAIGGYEVKMSTPLYTSGDFAFTGTARAAQTDAGIAFMGLDATQFDNANPNFAGVTFRVTDGYQQITPIDANVRIVGHTDAATYDGEEHSAAGYDAQIDEPLYTTADFTFSGTASAARTDQGTTYMGLEAAQFANTNKNFRTVTFTVQDGYVTVVPVEQVIVRVTGHTATSIYDGKAHEARGYDFASSDPLYTAADFTFSGTAAAERTEAGTTYMGLDASQFVNGSENFADVTFVVEDGYAKVNPATAAVQISGERAAYTYDGAEHSVSGYDVQISNPLYTANDFTFSGKASAARTDQGESYMGLTSEQFANTNPNFADVSFSVVDGCVAIAPVDQVTVLVTGRTSTDVYDGTAHSVTGYDFTASNPLYGADDFAFTGVAAATATDAGTVQMGLEAGQFSNVSANFSNVVFQVTDGYQQVTPATATVDIVGHVVNAAYDSQEHVAEGYDVRTSTSLYGQDDFTFSGQASAARTDEGTTQMGLTSEQFENTNPNFANVTFNVVDGRCVITPIDEVIVRITGHEGTDPYDGEEHVTTGYDVEISNPLYHESDFTFSGTARAAQTDAGTAYMGLTSEQFQNTSANFAKVTFQVVDGSQTVKPVDVTVDVVGNTNSAEYDGQEHAVEGYEFTASNALYTAADFTFSGFAQAARTDVGTTYMGLTSDQFANDNPNFAHVTFNVADGYQQVSPMTDEVVVTVTGHDDTVTYDGAEHQVNGYDVQISNPLFGQGDFLFTGSAQAARTDAGTTTMGLTSEQFANANPNFANVTFKVTDGSLTVRPASVTVYVTGHEATVDYDGASHGVAGYEFTTSNPLYTADDFEFTGAAEASRTDAGTAYMGLTSEQFANTNKNFDDVEFVVEDGSITVNPISVTVYVTGHSVTASYDSGTYKAEGYDVVSSDPLYTEADFTFSGSAVVECTDQGTAQMGLTADQFENANPNFINVEFVIVDGYVTVAPADAVVVTITGHTQTADYDGTEHAVEGYEFAASNPLYTADDFTFSGQAAAASTDAGTVYMGLTPEQFQNTSGNYADVTFVVQDGYAQVNPISATVDITGHTAVADYDGTRHAVSGYDVQSSSPLYTASDFTFSGQAAAARTDAGTTQMGLSPDQFKNTNANFRGVTFNVTDGYQQVAPIGVTVTVTGAVSTVQYDGAEHVAQGYGATASSLLYDPARDVTFTGSAAVTRMDAGISAMGLTSEQFANNNPNFANVEFAVTDGSLTIEPASTTVFVTGNHEAVVYDGAEHSVEGYTASAASSLYDAMSDLAFKGEASATRTDEGTTQMGLTSGQFENTNPNFANVQVVVTDGYLTVAPVDSVLVSIVGNFQTADYDGDVHKAQGYEFTASDPLYTAADFAFTGLASATRTDAGITGMNLTPDQFSNVNGNFANVVFDVTDGYVRVAPATAVVSVEGAQAVSVYDGLAHESAGYELSASNPLYDAHANAVFSGQASAVRTHVTHATGLVGQVDDSGRTHMGLASDQFTNANGNFQGVSFVVARDGYQQIVPAPLTVTTESASKPYDGQPLTASGKVSGFVAPNGVVETAGFAVTGQQVQVGESTNTYRIDWTGTAQKGDYAVSENLGTLVVTEAMAPVEPVEPGGGGEPVEPQPALYTLTVQYVYSDGTEAAPTQTMQLKAGESYDVVSPKIDGYTANYGRLTGAMLAQDVTVTVVYFSNQPVVPGGGEPGGGEPGGTTPGVPTTPGTTTPVPGVPTVPGVTPAPEVPSAPATATVTVDGDGDVVMQAIDDDATALARGDAEKAGTWSLFDVLATIVVVILGIVMLVALLAKRRDDDDDNPDDASSEAASAGAKTAEETAASAEASDSETPAAEGEDEQQVKRHAILRIVGAVLAVVSIVLLLVTQDFTQNMGIFDNWSLLFAIIAIVDVVLALFSRKRRSEQEEYSEQEG